MKKPKHKTSTEVFENTLSINNSSYALRLYVAGTTPQSVKAIMSIKKICEEYLKDRYVLEIVDIYQQPNLAEGEQIVAVPTLVKRHPFPLKKLIGDMSDTERVLIGLDLKSKK